MRRLAWTLVLLAGCQHTHTVTVVYPLTPVTPVIVQYRADPTGVKEPSGPAPYLETSGTHRGNKRHPGVGYTGRVR